MQEHMHEKNEVSSSHSAKRKKIVTNCGWPGIPHEQRVSAQFGTEALYYCSSPYGQVPLALPVSWFHSQANSFQ